MMIMLIITYYHLLSLIITYYHYHYHYDYDYHSGCHYDCIHDSAEKKTQIIGSLTIGLVGLFRDFFHETIRMGQKPLPSGKHTKNYGKSPCLMDKSTISMAIFNSKMLNYQRVNHMGMGQNLRTYHMNMGKESSIQPVIFFHSLGNLGCQVLDPFSCSFHLVMDHF